MVRVDIGFGAQGGVALIFALEMMHVGNDATAEEGDALICPRGREVLRTIGCR